MKSFRRLAVSYAVVMLLVIMGGATFAGSSKLSAPGVVFNTLYSFTGGADGAFPVAALIEDPQGNLYGTAQQGGIGGINGNGVVFRLTPAGKETTIYSFLGSPDGQWPSAPLVRDAKGRLYGTASGGNGNGTVFGIPSVGKDEILYAFCQQDYCADGSDPIAGLVSDGDGNGYGTTYMGGDASSGCDCGVVYKLNAKTRQETVLHVFTGGADGGNPAGGLISDHAGNFYGTAEQGGTNNGDCGFSGCGIIYKIDSTGNQTVLYTFTDSPDGSWPYSSLIRDENGVLYGTTLQGGNGYGTVFSFDPATAKETILYSFCPQYGCVDGDGSYSGLVRDAKGNLYGVTTYGGPNGEGTVFQVNPTGQETVLHGFAGGADGRQPEGGLLLDPKGHLFGTTAQGGAYNTGTVFEISTQ